MDFPRESALRRHHFAMRRSIKVSNLLPNLRLAAGGFLNDEESDSILTRTSDNMQQVDKVIEVLLTKTMQDFLWFCKVLEEHGYKWWSDKLKETAERVVFTPEGSVVSGVDALSSEQRHMVKQAVVHIVTHDSKPVRGTGFIAELHVEEQKKVLLMTSYAVLPSLSAAQKSDIYFGRINDDTPGTIIRGEELCDGHFFKTDDAEFHEWKKKYGYTAVEVKLDVLRKYLKKEEVPTPLSLVKAEMMAKMGDEGLEVGGMLYRVHYPAKPKSYARCESADQICVVEGPFIGYVSDVMQSGSGGSPILQEHNKELIVVGLHLGNMTIGGSIYITHNGTLITVIINHIRGEEYRDSEVPKVQSFVADAMENIESLLPPGMNIEPANGTPPPDDPEREEEEKQKLLSAYKEALDRHSSVPVEVTRCIIVGPSAVGKSSLKHLLVHNTPKAVKTSTPVMDTPEVVTTSSEQYAVEGGISAWKLVSQDVMGKSLHKAVRSKSYDEGRYPELLDIMMLIEEEESPDPSPPKRPKDSVGDVVSILEDGESRFMEENKGGDEAIELKGASFIHLLDTGGQPSFQDALPRLLDVPSTYIQVFNAAQDLDQPVPITFRPDDETVNDLPSSGETGWEMMLHSFSSMQTMAHKHSKELDAFQQKEGKQEKEGGQLPKLRIFVVGTFKDELIEEGRLEKTAQDIATHLEKLDGKPYFDSIQWDEHSGRPFYLIDNMSEEAEDKANVNRLRKHLSSAEDSSLKMKVPVTWLKCQEITRHTPQKFFRFDELKMFCLKKGFIDAENEDSQFHSLLKLFSLLGFYSFFNLKGVKYVCTDTGVFLKEVSKLLAVQFMPTKGAAMRKLKKTGILDSTDHKARKLFQELGMNQEMNHHWFLEALHHLGLAAHLPSQGKMKSFIPAVLVLPQKSGSDGLTASIAPLGFTYQMNDDDVLSESDLPRGVFCHLAVELIRCRWVILPYKSTRMLLTFQWKEFEISLKECPGFISLIPTVREQFSTTSALHTGCKELLGTVKECLILSTEAVLGTHFSKATEIAVGFRCPCTELGYPHLATPWENSLSCIQTKERQDYTSQQRIWFANVNGAELKHHPDQNCWTLEDTCKGTGSAPASANGGHALNQEERAVNAVLEHFRADFIKYMDAKAVVFELLHKDIIDGGDAEKITGNASPTERNQFLHLTLKRKCTVEALMSACDIIIAADGNPKMRALGEGMKDMLTGDGKYVPDTHHKK